MTDVIERLAEAMWNNNHVTDWNSHGCTEYDKSTYRSHAQAAYTAIVGDKVLVDREPTQDMKSAGAAERLRQDREDILNTGGIWTAMLNASEGG